VWCGMVPCATTLGVPYVTTMGMPWDSLDACTLLCSGCDMRRYSATHVMCTLAAHGATVHELQCTCSVMQCLALLCEAVDESCTPLRVNG